MEMLGRYGKLNEHQPGLETEAAGISEAVPSEPSFRFRPKMVLWVILALVALGAAATLYLTPYS